MVFSSEKVFINADHLGPAVAALIFSKFYFDLLIINFIGKAEGYVKGAADGGEIGHAPARLRYRFSKALGGTFAWPDTGYGFDEGAFAVFAVVLVFVYFKPEANLPNGFFANS